MSDLGTGTAGSGDYGLETISKEGQVPETRMKSASQVIDFVRRLWDNDTKRAWKRSLACGIYDGNPPYSAAKLRAAGRADACNVNWGTGRMYVESGEGAFYDLSTEAPGLIGIKTSHGESEQKKVDYSRIMSSEADMALKDNTKGGSWDFERQVSLGQMVLHGHGPLVFEDAFRVLPIAIHDADLKVPERTRADTHYWEVCTVDRDYYPPELYNFIRDEEAASKAGWDVGFTKKVISYAMDIRNQNGEMYNWEWYQQELKNSSLEYYDDTKVCRVALVFWKEFDGRITQVIVQRNDLAETEPKYLFFHQGRYEDFRQCVHPFYFDRGNGGFHHSVTGLGVKMYSGMEYENRLRCNLMDKAFAPKTLFHPTTTEATQRMQLTKLGDYGIMAPGWTMVQNPIQGYLTDGLEMLEESSNVMRANLSSYRQNAPMKQEGNPLTAKQVMYDASQQSSISKTTYSRFYEQLDALYAEIVRRLCNLNSTDERAKQFQKRCEDQGVPRECFGRIERVAAIRVIGQGSPFMRKAAVDSLMPVAAALPEEGRQNLMDDKIACEAGQAGVARYNPKMVKGKLPDDQQFEAMVGITMMKTGVPPIPTSSQNPLTFAAAYLHAGVQAIQSLQQGANLKDVLSFLELCGPAIIAHLKRFAKDPLRHQAWMQIEKQVKQLEQMTNELKKKYAQQQQKQQAQQQKGQRAMSNEQIKMLKAKGDLQIKAMRAKADLAEKAVRTRQDLAINDAKTATEIRRNNLRAFSR